MEKAKESIKVVIQRTTGEMQGIWKGKLIELERKMGSISVREALEVVR